MSTSAVPRIPPLVIGIKMVFTSEKSPTPPPFVTLATSQRKESKLERETRVHWAGEGAYGAALVESSGWTSHSRELHQSASAALLEEGARRLRVLGLNRPDQNASEPAARG
jgi:hypothetical protein